MPSILEKTLAQLLDDAIGHILAADSIAKRAVG
jgi:hypothetical protein